MKAVPCLDSVKIPTEDEDKTKGIFQVESHNVGISKQGEETLNLQKGLYQDGDNIDLKCFR